MNARVRHRIITALSQPLIYLYTKLKVNYHWDDIHRVKGPYLLLANHNLDMDPILISVASRRQIYFVASEHVLHSGWLSRLLMFCFGPIIHQKGAMGLASTKAILKKLREGDSVCLFPEGNRSFNGVTMPIGSVIGKLAKKTGVPLVTYRISGGYLTQPRWSLRYRRGQVRGRLMHVYTEQELEGMSAEEVTGAVNRDLHEDAYETQKAEHTAFRGTALAEGMEAVLFTCPQCRKIGTMHSRKDRVYCDCGYYCVYDEYGNLTRPDGTVWTVKEWDSWQKQELMQKRSAESDAELFSDRVTVLKYDASHRVLEKIEGTLHAWKDRICFEDKVIGMQEIAGVAVHSRNVLIVHLNGTDGHYEVHGGLPFSALKYAYLFK